MNRDIEKIITTANELTNMANTPNIFMPLSAEEAMRRLMFASMLMYKIDEAVKNAKIEE
ncbi:MAG: hypothetical protein IJ521_08860 [Schwartzia sp.]|nr:hypothetical protein [Schwartzia sp. (in: firmicutes)]